MKEQNPWIMAIRPKTLPAGAGPVLLGLALAYSQAHQLSIGIALATLCCSLLMQISSNLINDYYDGVKGLDKDDRLGPPRATSLGLIPSSQVKRSFQLTLGLSFLIGITLMYHGGLPILLIGLSSLFFSWAYTGGPYPLSYYGLGELFAFIFFGPIAVWGTWYLQSLDFSSPQSIFIISWGMAVGLLSAALMGVNNLRDRHTDRRSGKFTLATVLGNHKMRKLIMLFIIASQCLAQYLLYSRYHHHLYHLIGVTPLFPFSKEWWGLLRDTDGKDLNMTLATVGKYIFLFSLVYGLILSFS
jgi:1,4-dihydroxy-2-naphthoate polyprenyltransferase